MADEIKIEVLGKEFTFPDNETNQKMAANIARIKEAPTDSSDELNRPLKEGLNSIRDKLDDGSIKSASIEASLIVAKIHKTPTNNPNESLVDSTDGSHAIVITDEAVPVAPEVKPAPAVPVPAIPEVKSTEEKPQNTSDNKVAAEPKQSANHDRHHVAHHKFHNPYKKGSHEANFFEALHNAGFDVDGNLNHAISKASKTLHRHLVLVEDANQNHKLDKGEEFHIFSSGLNALNARLKAKGKPTLDF